MKKTLAALAFVLPAICIAQGSSLVSMTVGLRTPTDTKVSITSKGHDVRLILGDLFGQARKSFVLQSNIEFSLYLSLHDTPFEQALVIVCRQANLTCDLRDGVYYVRKGAAPDLGIAPKLLPRSLPKPVLPEGKLPVSVLAHRINTHMAKSPIRQVFAAFGDQARIKIEVAADVPQYKLDAFLINTSLKYALDQVTQAAGLTYRFTDHQSIQIVLEESKVTLVK